MKLKELEKRLDKEPTNLGLRVQVAGLMREAGRSVEAVELYRSVALAYRDQGRTQQAIAVCRSILDIAPEDAACQGLLASLQPAPGPTTKTSSRPSVPPASIPGEPNRRSSLDETPLPRPIPHHVMDPTSQKYRLSESELHLPLQPADQTPPPRSDAVPTSQMDIAAELETRQRVKIRTDQLAKLEEVTAPGEPDPEPEPQRPTPVRLTPITDLVPRLSPRDSPAARLTPAPARRETPDPDEPLTQPHNALAPRTSDDDLTVPRDRVQLFDDDDD